jgi:CBS domain-containing protein
MMKAFEITKKKQYNKRKKNRGETLMAVKDFMTRKVVYISPDTTVAHAADIMREQGLHRLPVIENDKLVGLVTEGTIAEASPSKATSLSIYEMNYLLNKTKIKDVMIRKVITVSQYASLEDATYLMLKNKVGILPVVDNEQVYGVITDRDIFKAFLEVSGYGEEGVRARFVTEDEVGVLEHIVRLLVEENLNISNTVNIPRKDGKVVIEVQIDGKVDLEALKKKFEDNQIHVDSIVHTEAKAL